MFCLLLRCFIAGIVCPILCCNAKTDDCVKRTEFETRLSEITASHLEDVSSLKREIRQLKEANTILEKKVKILKKLSENDDEPDNDVNDKHIILEHSDHDENKNFANDTEISANVFDESGMLTPDTKGRVKASDVPKRYLVDEQAVTPVAFTVLLNATDLVGLGQEQIVKFDKIMTNIGNAFDMRLGVFTAPSSGIYVVSLTLMTRPNETQYVYVMKDGVKVVHMYAAGSFYNTVTKMVVLQINKGEELWVQTSEYSGYSQYVHGYEHTLLTGFLLYSTDEIN